jgi:regulator of protease activity HflC (stomatin/prohibitin superfamily)
MFYILLVIAAAALVTFVVLRQITILEYERGLRYRRGRFEGVLHPGTYMVWPGRTVITKIDIRPTYLTVPGQEIITSDGVGLKVSVSAKYQVKDPALAVNSVADYRTALYTKLQLGLREIIASRPVESVMQDRAEINRLLLESSVANVGEFGVALLEAEVKDTMFPGELKRVFAQVVKARQEGLAALERARGETAALRNLANAAAMLEQRPTLLQLRLLQTIGQTSGNTVVLGMGSQPHAIPVRAPLSDGQQDSLPSGSEDES